MGLRLSQGIDPRDMQKRFGQPLIKKDAVDRLVTSGHLEWTGERLRTTREGRLLLDSVLAEIAA